MTRTVLILGASGRFGRACATAFTAAGWKVRRFDRNRDSLGHMAMSADVIVNGWNPAYPDWAAQVPALHAQVIEAAKASGSTFIVPGNVYVFGAETPAPWSGNSPHRAQNPLGRIRCRMEEAYRDSGVRTILLRAGDFIDTAPSGNWFDKIMAAKLAKGRFTYPGNPEIPHAWAYLPDLARAAVKLAEREDLDLFEDIPFPGYTLSGQQMLAALNSRLARPAELRVMAWQPLRLAAPFWPMGRCLLEMRYLWETPHWLDGSRFDELLPGFRATPVQQALASAVPRSLLQKDVYPNQPVAAAGAA